jgi:hypothetical protein
METELTMRDLAGDPLIALMMRADGIGEDELSMLMRSVARQEVERLQQRLRQASAAAFYKRLDKALDGRMADMRRLA